MSLAMLCVSVLIFWMVWAVLWKKVLLSATESAFLRLKYDARLWFIDNGYGTSHPIYISLIERIDRLILKINSATLANFLIFLIQQENGENDNTQVRKSFKEEFACDDPKINTYIKDIFEKLTNYIIIRAFLSNFLMVILLCIFGIIECFKKFILSILQFGRRNTHTVKFICKSASTSIVISVIAYLPWFRVEEKDKVATLYTYHTTVSHSQGS